MTERESPEFTPEPLVTPEAIVEPSGFVNTGWFKSPFRKANLQDAPIEHALSSLRKGPLRGVEAAYRRMRLKNWHYTSVASEEVFFACAIVDAGYVGTAFAYVVDRKSGVMHEWTTLLPLSRGIVIAPSSLDGLTRVEKVGWGYIELGNDSQRGVRTIDAKLEGTLGTRNKPSLRVKLEIWDWGSDPDPVVVVEQSARGRWLYTHKCYGLEAGGTVRCGPIDCTLKQGQAHAGLDWNLGYRPYETWWNWAAGGGFAEDGTRVGFNLTAHRPWDERHAASSETDATDCGLWIGGRCIKLDRVEFSYQPRAILQPWRIRDADGLVDLTFSPVGKRVDDVNFGVVASQFQQPYGVFRGTLRTPEGDTKQLRDVFGVTEQHFARW
jgi:hypothetical protein